MPTLTIAFVQLLEQIQYATKRVNRLATKYILCTYVQACRNSLTGIREISERGVCHSVWCQKQTSKLYLATWIQSDRRCYESFTAPIGPAYKLGTLNFSNAIVEYFHEGQTSAERYRANIATRFLRASISRSIWRKSG